MSSMSDLLVEHYHVNPRDIEKAENYQKRFGGRLEQILVNMGSLSDDRLAPLYSQFLNMPLIDMTIWQEAEQPTVDKADLEFLIEHQWAPLAIEGNNWVLAAKFPLDLEVNQFLQQHQICLLYTSDAADD